MRTSIISQHSTATTICPGLLAPHCAEKRRPNTKPLNNRSGQRSIGTLSFRGRQSNSMTAASKPGTATQPAQSSTRHAARSQSFSSQHSYLSLLQDIRYDLDGRCCRLHELKSYPTQPCRNTAAVQDSNQRHLKLIVSAESIAESTAANLQLPGRKINVYYLRRDGKYQVRSALFVFQLFLLLKCHMPILRFHALFAGLGAACLGRCQSRDHMGRASQAH